MAAVIEPTWRRIAGVHLEEDGTAGAVFLAHDTVSSVVHCYDAALFRAEVPAVISEGIAARGRWIPIAWRKPDKEFAESLRSAGLNLLPEPVADNQAVAEVISREIWQRLRAGRFRVDKRVFEWLNEYRSFNREESKVPMNGFPLMSATRYAIEHLAYAKAQSHSVMKGAQYPKVAII